MAQNYEIDIKRFNGQDYDTLLPTPAAHASTHQADGSDPLTLQAGNYGALSIPTSAYQNTSITRAKLAQDVLVSPLKFFSGNSYTIAAEDIGLTIMNSYTSGDNDEKTVNLTYDVSHSLPIGTVIAVVRPEANVTKISFGENLRVGIPGNDNWLTAPTVSISNRFSTVALMLKSLGAQDYWFLTGDVEVVS